MIDRGGGSDLPILAPRGCTGLDVFTDKVRFARHGRRVVECRFLSGSVQKPDVWLMWFVETGPSAVKRPVAPDTIEACRHALRGQFDDRFGTPEAAEHTEARMAFCEADHDDGNSVTSFSRMWDAARNPTAEELDFYTAAAGRP